jgi:hypothetical protein
LEVLAQQSLLRNRAENEAPDAPEAIDTDFSHFCFFLYFWMRCGRNGYLKIPAPGGQSFGLFRRREAAAP